LNESPASHSSAVYKPLQALDFPNRFHLKSPSPLGFEKHNLRHGHPRRRRQIVHLKNPDITIPSTPPRPQMAPLCVAYEFPSDPTGFRGWSFSTALHFRRQPKVMDLGLISGASSIVKSTSSPELHRLPHRLPSRPRCPSKRAIAITFPHNDSVPIVRQSRSAHSPISRRPRRSRRQTLRRRLRRPQRRRDAPHQDVRHVRPAFPFFKRLLGVVVPKNN